MQLQLEGLRACLPPSYDAEWSTFVKFTPAEEQSGSATVKASSREYRTKAKFRSSTPSYKQRFDLPVNQLFPRFRMLRFSVMGWQVTS